MEGVRARGEMSSFSTMENSCVILRCLFAPRRRRSDHFEENAQTAGNGKVDLLFVYDTGPIYFDVYGLLKNRVDTLLLIKIDIERFIFNTYNMNQNNSN